MKTRPISLLRILARLLLAGAISALAISAVAAAVTSEQVSLTLPDGAGELAGTLATADGADTIVVLVSGSGPTDRDGNQPTLRNDSLRLVAEGLASLGVSTLRYDKRGAGHSVVHGFREEDVQLQTYADDVVRWVEWLRRRGPHRHIGLLGHSEGGLVASLAANRAQASFVVLLETPGRPVDQVLQAQLDRKLPPELAKQAAAIIGELKAGRTVADVPEPLRFVFRPGVQPYWISMFSHPPTELVRGLAMPLLIVQGNQDLQVELSDAQRLSSAQPAASACLVQGMNHVLKTVATPADQGKAYSDPSVPLSKEVLDDVARFLDGLRRGTPASAGAAGVCVTPLPSAPR
jgi:pimeloyl-ACP methyl ester carboxylesterase